MFLVGVNLPVIGYTIASLLVINASAIAAFFLGIMTVSPLLVIVGSLFVVVPLIMWLELPNTDKDLPFLDYLKNVYSNEVNISDNQCVAGEACDSDY